MIAVVIIVCCLWCEALGLESKVCVHEGFVAVGLDSSMLREGVWGKKNKVGPWACHPEQG